MYNVHNCPREGGGWSKLGKIKSTQLLNDPLSKYVCISTVGQVSFRWKDGCCKNNSTIACHKTAPTQLSRWSFEPQFKKIVLPFPVLRS